MSTIAVLNGTKSHDDAAGGWPFWLSGLVLCGAFLISMLFFNGPRQNIEGKEPDWVPYRTPWLGHAYMYIFHNLEFLRYVRSIQNGRSIMRIRFGPQKFYLVTGADNAQAVLRNSGGIRYLSANEMVHRILKQLEAMTDGDLAKFRVDNSGRSHIPLPDTSVPEDKRLWAPQHRIFVDNLTSSRSVDVMTEKFAELFSARALGHRAVGEWESIKLYEFVKQAMVESATIALCGSELLEQNPDFVRAYWDYDASVFGLIFGIPKWIYPKAYTRRDTWNHMGEKWFRSAYEKLDRIGDDEAWEPNFGTKFVRERQRLLKDRDFDIQSRVGMHLGTIWALNTNTIPIVGWALIEMIHDVELFQAIRTEASSAFELTHDGSYKLDLHKLVNLPLLQSVYAETLRLHDSINITREVTQDMVLDGYSLRKGYLIQAPSHLAHLDESIWGEKDHPASEFWAERHIFHVERTDENGKIIKVPEFSISKRSKNFFPYGGGLTICPGRHMAKREILIAVATIVVNFDIELLEYLNADGSKSNRGPIDDPWYGGFGSMPPDRDLRIKWKRIKM